MQSTVNNNIATMQWLYIQSRVSNNLDHKFINTVHITVYPFLETAKGGRLSPRSWLVANTLTSDTKSMCFKYVWPAILVKRGKFWRKIYNRLQSSYWAYTFSAAVYNRLQSSYWAYTFSAGVYNCLQSSYWAYTFSALVYNRLQSSYWAYTFSAAVSGDSFPLALFI